MTHFLTASSLEYPKSERDEIGKSSSSRQSPSQGIAAAESKQKRVDDIALTMG